MKKIKENLQAIAIILLALSALYYTFIYLPLKFETSMKIECYEKGKTAVEEIFTGMSDDVIQMNSKYLYSKDLNTCLYKTGYYDNEGTSDWVIDALTNETLIYFYGDLAGNGVLCYSTLDESWICSSKSEYSDFADKIFN